MASTTKFYSVVSGTKTGVFSSWAECKSHVVGVEGSKFSIFTSEDEAYEHFCANSSASSSAAPTKKKGPGARKLELKAMETKHYAVAIGRLPGIYDSHGEMMRQTKGYEGAKFKTFGTEAEAQLWIDRIQSIHLAKRSAAAKQMVASSSNSPVNKRDGSGSSSTSAKKTASSKSGASYYAVKVGRVPGIYMTWKECQAQTAGFPKPEFKKFSTEEDALNFIKVEEDDGLPYPIRIFTDGSFKEGKAGFGIAVYKNNELVFESYGPVNGTNNTAELTAILELFKYVTREMPNDTVKRIEIIADSHYSLSTITSYYATWSEKDRSGRENIEIIGKCYDLWIKLKDAGYKIKSTHIDSHQESSDVDSDISHNNYVDTLADLGRTGKKEVAYYEGE